MIDGIVRDQYHEKLNIIREKRVGKPSIFMFVVHLGKTYATIHARELYLLARVKFLRGHDGTSWHIHARELYLLARVKFLRGHDGTSWHIRKIVNNSLRKTG